MIKLFNIIGARPQIIKSAAVSRAIESHFSDKIKDIPIHTGQHYDTNMSGVFFNELKIPHPQFNLEVGSGTHARQTAEIMVKLEELAFQEKPDAMVIYGDTNSTIGASLAASKTGIPIVHIEAGMRSFNKSMPEEINRVLTDHASTLLFTPTQAGYKNLIREGFSGENTPPFTIDNPGIFHCGDVMYDNSLFFARLADTSSNILEKHSFRKEDFILFTLHRPVNTDTPSRLANILQTMVSLAEDNKTKVIFPVHPRTKEKIKQIDPAIQKQLFNSAYIILTEPLGFLDMTTLESNARFIITDSGGVQKEAYFFKKPSLVTRAETEWVEIIETGAGYLVDADSKRITEAFQKCLSQAHDHYPAIFGDGNAGSFICEKIIENFN